MPAVLAGQKYHANGQKYIVKFEITGKVMGEKEAAREMKKNTNFEMNYIRLDIYNDVGLSYCDGLGLKTNSGCWRGMPMLGNHMETTPAHETGHLFGYDSGLETDSKWRTHDEWKGERYPSIMAAWDAGHPNFGVPDELLGNRRVRPETIARIFKGNNLSPGSVVKLGGLTNLYHKEYKGKK